MRDYWGYGKATKPMLPMIAVPTTAGTGSEAQSYCIVTDPGNAHSDGVRRRQSHLLLGHPVIPRLTLSQPPRACRGHRLRRPLACARNTGLDAPHRALGNPSALGLEPDQTATDRMLNHP